jgi:hypothetical protein
MQSVKYNFIVVQRRKSHVAARLRLENIRVNRTHYAQSHVRGISYYDLMVFI